MYVRRTCRLAAMSRTGCSCVHRRHSCLHAPSLCKSSGSIVISFVKNFIELFAKSIRVKASRIKLTIATEDAAETALTYTAVTQSVNVLFPLLDGLKAVKKLPRGKELSVDADFLSDKSSADVDVELYVRVGSAVGALCKAAIRAFKKAVKDQIKRLEKNK